MERLTERTAQGFGILAESADFKDGLCTAGKALDRLAAYEDTGLEPEEITLEPEPCVFYCNRRCTLDGDWCAEGPGCPKETDKETATHLLDLAAAEKAGRLVVLPPEGGEDLALCVIAHDEGDLYKTEVWRVGAPDNLVGLLSCMADEVAKAMRVSYSSLLRTMLRHPSINERAAQLTRMKEEM